MVEQISSDQIQNLSSLILSNSDLQIQLSLLIVGLVSIFSIYYKFASWIRRLKFSYTRPHLSRFIQKAVIPFFALALISTTNLYAVKQTFAMILNSVNILVIGYTLSQLIPIILRKRDSDQKEREDFENWKIKHGYVDDPCGTCDVCSG